MSRIPPIPHIPLNTAERLQVGDVVQIAVQLTDKFNGSPYWWTRFAIVVKKRKFDKLSFTALTLKLNPDFDKDVREIDLREKTDRQVVRFLPEPWPQGVAAMHMKLLMTGKIKIEEE